MVEAHFVLPDVLLDPLGVAVRARSVRWQLGLGWLLPALGALAAALRPTAIPPPGTCAKGSRGSLRLESLGVRPIIRAPPLS